eukprot:6932248-Prymnesium_polylepis.1
MDYVDPLRPPPGSVGRRAHVGAHGHVERVAVEVHVACPRACGLWTATSGLGVGPTRAVCLRNGRRCLEGTGGRIGHVVCK